MSILGCELSPLAHVLTSGPQLVVLFWEIVETLGGGTNWRKWGLERVLLKVTPSPWTPFLFWASWLPRTEQSYFTIPSPSWKSETYETLGGISISSFTLWLQLCKVWQEDCYRDAAVTKPVCLTRCWKRLVGGIRKQLEKWARESLGYCKHSLLHAWFWWERQRAETIGM